MVCRPLPRARTPANVQRQAHRVLTQVILIGGRVLGRAFAEAYRQANASAKYAKANQGAGGGAMGVSRQLDVGEAFKVLGIKTDGLTAETLGTRYKLLFERNDPKKGGSFYLQSKVFRARERLAAELAKGGGATPAPA